MNNIQLIIVFKIGRSGIELLTGHPIYLEQNPFSALPVSGVPMYSIFNGAKKV